MDKQDIEEMAKEREEIRELMRLLDKCVHLNPMYKFEVATVIYGNNYRKLPENAVVIPKEISCYENIEEGVRTFRLDGKKVDFTNEQIMALTQILHFKEMNGNDIRKETAEKFAKMAKEALRYVDCTDELYYAFRGKIDEICKEITEKGV